MDKQKQIEDMAHNLCLKERDCEDCERNGVCLSYSTATIIYNAGYRKIPEGVVVLTKEDMKKYAKDCIVGQETGLDIINGLIARAERYKDKVKQARKETAREVLQAMLRWKNNLVIALGYTNEVSFDCLLEETAQRYGVEVE